MFSLPFSRASPRLNRQSSSTSGSTKLPSDDLKKGSWTLVQDPPTDTPDELDLELQNLNSCLVLLTEVFPDIQAEVFREMLLNVSKESRVEIVTGYLLKDKAKWVQGRYKTGIHDKELAVKGIGNSGLRRDTVEKQETFRSTLYRQAVKSALYAEFKGLSHATIKAVLAEHNSSYTDSRPVLQQLSSKSWRFYLTNLWSKKADTSSALSHPLINWQAPYGDDCPAIPYLRRTESPELDRELYDFYIQPVKQRREREQLKRDATLAMEIAEAEATKHDALFECQCCYSSVVFEEIAACSAGDHMVCFQCLRFALNEALFGQGWAKTIDVDRMTIRCLAPSDNGCTACVPGDKVERATLSGPEDGAKTYQQFKARIAQHSLDKCEAPLLRCPFCPYAEVDETPEFQIAGLDRISHRLTSRFGYSKGSNASFVGLLAILVVLILLPIVHLVVSLLQTICTTDFQVSHKRALGKKRGLRFQCLSSDCGIASCSNCLVRWQDPHICYETAKKSLRHAIEAATTAVVKRTCPKCNTSFVKSTGCNKLVCPCGYSMCYICRSPIGQEGYTHFCQHFRVSGGRCSECDRCDLYKVEDEDAIIKKAAAQAERDWRAKQGQPAGTDRLGAIKEQVLRGSNGGGWWTFDDVLDGFVDLVLA